MNNALLSSKNMCWCTPQDFFDALNEEFGFVLDPAETDKTAKCSLYYTPETDGLSQSWDRGGAVFCNPPYGREIGKWVQKAFKEARGGYPIVLLIPARTDTAYFHDYIYGKAEIRFIRGRLRFTDDNGNAAGPAPFPSMVVIYNRKTAPNMDAVEVVRCKDCIYYHKAHVLCKDGTEKDFSEFPPEAIGTAGFVSVNYGINVGGKCEFEKNCGYEVDKSVYREPDDFCSRGKTKGR